MKRGCENVVSADKAANQIVLSKLGKSAKEPPKVFTFDGVFPADTSQRAVYEEAVFPLVESVIEGYNGTIFAYGQTGCGKTFTMVGPKEPEKTELRGVIPNAFTHIFSTVSAFDKARRSLLRCSYLEIYNEAIHDLLEYRLDRKLELKEEPNKGVYVKGLTTVIVKNIEDIEGAMRNGSVNRHTAETSMNKDSSRSHCIFTIYIETAENQADGEQRIKAGKLNLVDLAGSERQSKTHAEGDRLKEATKINLSLSALGNVISALVDGKSTHIPYRDSKLTRLLQDSLGGNTKTVMVACVSPAGMNYDETLSTLRYASSAKFIRNKPRINEDPKDALLKQYETEIQQLRSMIKRLENGDAVDTELKAIVEAQTEADPEVRSLQDLAGEHSRVALSKLEQEKADLQKDREQVEAKLKAREEECGAEKRQRGQMESMLQMLEQKMVMGGREMEEREKEQTRRCQEMQLKLRKQREKEQRILEDQARKQQAIHDVQKSYISIQEELKDKNAALQDARTKYASDQAEIADLGREHQEEKDALLSTIRESTRELDLYKKIVDNMLSEGEFDKLRHKADWDDEARGWSVPLFVVQNRQLLFPKLPKSQGMPQHNDQLG